MKTCTRYVIEANNDKCKDKNYLFILYNLDYLLFYIIYRNWISLSLSLLVTMQAYTII